MPHNDWQCSLSFSTTITLSTCKTISFPWLCQHQKNLFLLLKTVHIELNSEACLAWFNDCWIMKNNLTLNSCQTFIEKWLVCYCIYFGFLFFWYLVYYNKQQWQHFFSFFKPFHYRCLCQLKLYNFDGVAKKIRSVQVRMIHRTFEICHWFVSCLLFLLLPNVFQRNC